MGEVLRDLLGTSVGIRVHHTGAASATRALEGETGVVVAPLGSAPEHGVLLELEGALACTLVALALKRPVPKLMSPGVVPETTWGAVAAIVAATLRRAHAGTALEVRRANPTAAFEAGLLHPGSDAIAVTMTVLVGDEAFAARAVFGGGALGAVPPEDARRWGRAALASLGATPLGIPIVACAVEMTVAGVAALGPGDVLLPGEWPVDSGLNGEVWLAGPDSETGVRVALVGGSGIVLRGERQPLCATEGTMTDEGGRAALVDAIGDVPVVVRVELGEATLSAREWASLAPGDVVGLARRVGEQVLLRIGGVPVARGELVAIDGEIGVRIVTRLAEETTA
jgi:flagellar motor switch/type III secretory pathway protein FliN